MNTLQFADNLTRLRREKKVTQEELADFIGVTKASVSKWETRQSLPDILILPQLASFFNVTVDELLGYSPQLSKEQIQKQYYRLAGEFASRPFEDVIKESEELVRKYYSCYSFLYQICLLWLNHFMLAGDEKRGQEILKKADQLCGHILGDCKDIRICNETVMIRAVIRLMQGRVNEVIEQLEELDQTQRMERTADSLLIQAYQMAGEKEKAIRRTQVSMFTHLMLLIDGATLYLDIQKEEMELCSEIIRRTDEICKLFAVERLVPNSAALFHLEAAMVYTMHHHTEEALERVRLYGTVIDWMLKEENLERHGDDYFDTISKWYDSFDLGGRAPRDKKTIRDSAVQGLMHPAFDEIREQEIFRNTIRILKEE